MAKLRAIQVITVLAAVLAVGYALFRGEDIRAFLQSGGRHPAAPIVMLLLGGYMFLPVPSSVLMTTNGAWFGLPGGAAISFLGSMLAWISWYWLGRLLGWGFVHPALLGPLGRDGRRAARDAGTAGRGAALTPGPSLLCQGEGGEGGRDAALSIERLLADHFHRYGIALLIVTRPVPVLAGLIAATAGVTRMNWWRFLAGAALGVAPMAVFYVYVGWQWGTIDHSPVALAVAVGIPLLLYMLVARPFQRKYQGG